MSGSLEHALAFALVSSPYVSPSVPATMRVLAVVISLILASMITSSAFAQEQKPPIPVAEPQKVPVSIDQALYLIRSTLLTLNDANRSGNYSVFRDLAAPDFQAKNTAADLAQIFLDLRRRNFNMYAVAVDAPQLSSPPAFDGDKLLRLTGFFPTKPLQINFDLLFQNVGGEWRVLGISVATPPAPTQPAETAAPKVPPTEPPKPLSRTPRKDPPSSKQQ
jgi:hypothetical protein